MTTKDFVSTTELANASGNTEAKIKYYSDEGLLLYYKGGSKGRTTEKRYPLTKNLEILKNIEELKKKGHTIATLKEYFKTDLLRGVDRADNKFEKYLKRVITRHFYQLEIELFRCTARESYIFTYWDGEQQPRDVMIDVHAITNEGELEFTDWISKEVAAGSAALLVLMQLAMRLGLDVRDEKITHIWDKKVREELDQEKRTIWGLVNTTDQA